MLIIHQSGQSSHRYGSNERVPLKAIVLSSDFAVNRAKRK